MDKKETTSARHGSISGKKWILSSALVIVTLAVYGNTLNAPFILDDIPKIAKNPDIKKLDNLKTRLVYPYARESRNFQRNDPSRPLLYLTFTLNYHFGKLNTRGYHLVNTLLHAFNAVLFFFLSRRILLCAFGAGANAPAFFAALLFAVHPVNTSAVSYIFSRSDILAAFFYLGALLSFAVASDRNRKIYILTPACFILALFSKQVSVTLPAAVLLFDLAIISGFSVKEVLKRKYRHILLWAVLAAYLAYRFSYFGGIGDLEARSSWDRFSYVVTQPYAILRYLQLLIFPSGLCIDHSIRPVPGMLYPGFLAPSALIALVLTAAYMSYRKKAPASGIMVFSILWFFITISPTSSFLPTTSALVENRLYLPGMGFFLATSMLIFRFFGANRAGRAPGNRLLIIVAVLYASSLAGASVKRNSFYRDPALLWQDAIAKYPSEARSHNNLGLIYYERKEYDRAAGEYLSSIAADPKYENAYNNLGALYKETGNSAGAVEAFRKVIELNPEQEDAHSNLGVLYRDRGEYEKAIGEFRKALEINPESADAHNNLASSYSETREFGRAAEEFRKILEINPDYARGYYNLGVLYCELKDYPQALPEFKKALQLDPGMTDAHNNLGFVYYMLKDYGKALDEYRLLLKLEPDNNKARSMINRIEGG